MRYHESGLFGAGPAIWYGTDAPDGDAGDWVRAPIGSRYYRKLGASNGGIWYEKKSTAALDGDWRPVGGSIIQTVAIADFTDGGSTAGTKALAYTIPVGATVVRAFVQALTGFTGDTSCTLIIGDGSVTNRYMTGTPSIFTTAAGETDLGAVSGVAYHSAAKTVTLTATSNADFTNVTAGRLTVVIVLG